MKQQPAEETKTDVYALNQVQLNDLKRRISRRGDTSLTFSWIVVARLLATIDEMQLENQVNDLDL